jgi:hypothetical protein
MTSPMVSEVSLRMVGFYQLGADWRRKRDLNSGVKTKGDREPIRL